MEVTDNNLNTLANYLQQTLNPDPDVRKPAEKFLERVETNQNYPVLLLNAVNKSNFDLNIRVAGAIFFKNYVKRNWRQLEDEPNKIHEADRDSIKLLIIGLMLKSPEQIQKQLSDAISIIGREDFPAKWPNLIHEMVKHFQSGDFHLINGVLRTAHSIFKRYRYEFKSQELWLEIKFVLDNFAKPLTDLFICTMQLAETHSTNPVALKVIFSSLVLIAKVFYSLNCQDLPEFFEDNMATWMENFLKLMVINNELLKTDENEVGVLEQLKSQICENITLYAQKYDEEFATYLSPFVNAVWQLLTSTGQETKYDLLVSHAIHFLSSVAERSNYKDLFGESSALGTICQNVIIPNMEFRETDEELFEDNAEEYIRRDIEGSDIDTRRRAACDLVRALAKHFETSITSVFSQYVNAMLQNYSKDPANQWKSKDAAIYLVTSMTAKAQTSKHGTTQTNEFVNIQDFFRDNILGDLQSNNVNEFPVLKADAIKYVVTFRNQLPKEVIIGTLPSIINLLTAANIVVHTYAAHAVERIFTIKDASGGPSLKSQDLQTYVEILLKNLFLCLNHPGSSENEYVMKAIMRSFVALQESVIPFIPTLLPKLTYKLTEVSKNPRKPHFNHYLFETISLAIRIVCRTNNKSIKCFEDALFPVFEGILQQDIQDFIPYVFQLLSLLLELQEAPIPEHYMSLFPCLLSPILWERPGNIHPLSRLLQAYIAKGSQQVVSTQKLSAILGVFQKLIASKSNDHEGFHIMQTLVEHIPPGELYNYLKQVFVLLFHRLQNSKTTKYIKCLLAFFMLFSYKYSAQSLIDMIDDIQTRMFGMVLERLIIPDIQKVSGNIERKVCAMGIIKLLTEVPALIDGGYSQYWAPLLQALIGLFELPEDEDVPEDEHFIEIEETPGYQSAYLHLVFAGEKERDPFNGAIHDPRLHLAHSLQKLSVNHPNKLTPVISSGLSPEALKHLTQYLQAANVQLA